MMLGIEFQSLGAAAWNDISPLFDLVGGMTSSLCEDERNKRPGLYGICLRAAGLQPPTKIVGKAENEHLDYNNI